MSSKSGAAQVIRDAPRNPVAPVKIATRRLVSSLIRRAHPAIRVPSACGFPVRRTSFCKIVSREHMPWEDISYQLARDQAIELLWWKTEAGSAKRNVRSDEAVSRRKLACGHA